MKTKYVLQNTVCKTPVKKESLIDKFLKYYRENVAIINAGLAAASGSSNYSLYEAFAM